MSLYADPISKLINELSRLPGVGEKTAARLAFYILSLSKDEVAGLANSILNAKNEISLCSNCFNLSDKDPCNICENGNRSSEYICVVEKTKDLVAIERSGEFKGKYHVLHGALSPLHGIGPDKLKIRELIDRIKEEKGLKEVIIATNPNMEGEATALYLSKLIKPLDVKVTRIAYGVPMGGEIEYIDSATISRSIDGRSTM